MALPSRSLNRIERRPHDGDPHLNEEWLVTNGLGGYASGTVVGALTRRYHGLLIAALPNPLGRSMTLNALSERFRLPNRDVFFTGPNELIGVDPPGTLAPTQFRLEGGLPVWHYELGGFVLEKRVLMVHRQNTVHVAYRLVSGPAPIRLALRPGVHFRSHDASVSTPLAKKYILTITGDNYDLCAGDSPYPALRMYCLPAVPFTADRKEIDDILFRTEETRGYESQGSMWSPGYFRCDLKPGDELTFVATTESQEIHDALTPRAAADAENARRETLLVTAHTSDDSFGSEMTLAADQFLVLPTGRTEDAARAHAAGEELRTVIAGYHWFTDWGRDTMISLEGLTISTGRTTEAGWILRTFAQHIQDGLIPNLFPEGSTEGLYHTADATLWFFHALSRYVTATGDRVTLRLLIPKLIDIVEHHVAGTRFNIHVDPVDGLLIQGQEGYQLTWMDAKVGDWVVTPRRGKAVEINALWYNALRLLQGWLEEEPTLGDPAAFGALAEKARESFNRRFWNPGTGFLFDVVDGETGGDDPSCRPNQLFAISLPNPVLDPARWKAVLDTAQQKLLTPVGLRSLSPDHPDYKPRYDGDLRARDAAYHQGTVWAWLIGPFIDAWLKVYPERREEARGFLAGFESRLNEACIGSIGEIFDAEEPHTPRACIAQAWSVAEVFRCHELLKRA